MTPAEQSAIGIIGGADGPTAIFVSEFPIGLVVIGVIAGVTVLLNRLLSGEKK